MCVEKVWVAFTHDEAVIQRVAEYGAANTLSYTQSQEERHAEGGRIGGPRRLDRDLHHQDN